MTLVNRLGTAISAIALATIGAVGLTACSPATSSAITPLSPEATALTSVGFAPADLVAATPSSPGASPGTAAGSGRGGLAGRPRLRALLIRRALAGRVLHGEVVVSTKANGDVTIDVERGVITSISASSITVQASDGFVLTWTIGNPIHVIEHRTTVQPSDLKAGDTIGVAGTKTGDTVTAKLIVVPVQQGGSGGS